MDDAREPRTALLLNRDDTIVDLGTFMPIATVGMRGAVGAFAVIHRGFETFTHLYLVPLDAVRARREVRLAAVFPGEAIGQAADWCGERLRPVPSPVQEERLAA